TAAAEVRLRFSGFVKTVSGPAFPTGGRESFSTVAGSENDSRPPAGREGNSESAHANNPSGHVAHGGNGHRPANGNGNGNGNGAGHHVDVTTAAAPGEIGDLIGGGALTRSEAEAIIQSVAREVEVTRRLYRSGESEYLIDGHICRLRDVHDLLMDTGLGAK